MMRLRSNEGHPCGAQRSVARQSVVWRFIAQRCLRTFAFTLALALLTAPPVSSASPPAFAFALIGDIPYNPLEVRMIGPMFESFDSDLAFAVHVGDIKASWERCDDALIGARLDLLGTSPVPLVFVPGDNEWTDCARPRAGGFDPHERLDWLRERVFSHAAPLAASTGGPLREFERQADQRADGLPENVRWRQDGVRFVTLNVPGSNNGLSAKSLDAADWRTRMGLDSAWLRDTYRLAARDHDVAMVVITHANPNFDRDLPGNVADPHAGAGRSGVLTLDRLAGRTDGYAGFRALLFEASSAFAGPTLFLHGDTHHHRVERLSPKLLRVESYGSPFSNLWLRIDVEPGSPDPFTITSRRVDRDPPLQ